MTDDNGLQPGATAVADESDEDPLFALNYSLLEWLGGQPGVTDVASTQGDPGKHGIAGFLLDGRPVSLTINWTE